MSTVLEIKNLTKKYGNFVALDNLSLTINQGNIFGILGPNGSGKTTTLGMVLDVINATGGTYSWFGAEQVSNSRNRIGAILEHPIFYPELSGYKNLEIAALIKQVDVSRIEPVLKRVGLLGRKDSAFKTYSLGMKQRLALASALLSDPDVLVLDEPTNGLDPQGINQMRELILSIAREGKTIIISSHILDEIQKMCTHFAILKNGKLLKQGHISEILMSKNQFTVNSKSTGMLEVLKKHPNYTSVKKDGDSYLVTFNDLIKGGELNEFCFKNNVVLSEIIEHKTSLEEEFLAIIK